MGHVDWSAVLTMQCSYDVAEGTIERRVETGRKDVCKYDAASCPVGLSEIRL